MLSRETKNTRVREDAGVETRKGKGDGSGESRYRDNFAILRGMRDGKGEASPLGFAWIVSRTS
ncbi:MAG: hypothetical protein EBV06_16170 [Planctomycetia bacterium]|nr:hypothetical protein [Planctomycetia bacterium]